MNCILCNCAVGCEALIEIYVTFTTHSNTLLVNFIKKILNYNLNKFQHSKYLCKACYNIFEELDFTQLSCIRLQKQIFDRCLLNDCDRFLKDVSCQTDLETAFENVTTDLCDKELFQEIKTEAEDPPRNNICNSINDLDVHAIKGRSLRSRIHRQKQSKSHACKECNKRFVSRNSLFIHMKRKHADNNGIVSKNQPDIIKDQCVEFSEGHLKVENVTDIESPLNDDCCSSSSSNSSSSSSSSNSTADDVKRRTKKNLCTVKPLKYSCPQCTKMWRTKSELRNHIASHSTLRPYICEICGQAYKHKYALDVHVGMHNGINPFSCQYCHKSFTQKGALQRHLPLHTGEAPYQCDLCGKRFVHHTSFKMHTLVHTGQKAYKCNVCGLALLSASHLKRHMRVHTGERPYACTQCGKRFAERYNLAAHQRLHEAGQSEPSKRLYRCQLCGVGFDRRPKLEEHLSNNHNKISDTDQSRNWIGHFLSNPPYSQNDLTAEEAQEVILTN